MRCICHEFSSLVINAQTEAVAGAILRQHSRDHGSIVLSLDFHNPGASPFHRMQLFRLAFAVQFSCESQIRIWQGNVRCVQRVNALCRFLIFRPQRPRLCCALCMQICFQFGMQRPQRVQRVRFDMVFFFFLEIMFSIPRVRCSHPVHMSWSMIYGKMNTSESQYRFVRLHYYLL